MAGLADAINSINQAQNAINGALPLSSSAADQFKSDGFTVPATFSADGTGLPSSKVSSFRDATFKRNIITWFVPQFGIVRMYINPHQIRYMHKKVIDKAKTKGGFTLQYWGEDLDVLSINGTTGSSGIEGINVLYEIYRAEQYAFDATGLTMAANNSQLSLSNTLGDLGSMVGGSTGGTIGSVVGGLLGAGAPNSNLSAQNILSLAQLAFTVEMYYSGWVYRGYFNNMNVTEAADNFLFQYDMEFVVTQRRGYRTNYLPFHRSAIDGPSSYTTPNSFSGNIQT